MTKYKCRFCSKSEAVVVDSGESYDSGDDWYDMLCKRVVRLGHMGRT